jgi:hypothetical protein
MDDAIFVEPYFPDGVQYIITTSSSHYISFVNEVIVPEYLHVKGILDPLDVEYAIFQQLGKHPRIIEFKGRH